MGYPFAVACSRLRSTTPDSSSVCSEEEVGDEDDEEDGAWRVSAQPTLALLQTFRGLTCFLLSMLHLRPLFLPSRTAAPWIRARPNPAR
jgi:hypothetical protein